MSGHRQAALALHPLSAEDRTLILGDLPDADASRLRAHLAELDELGFAPEVTAAAYEHAPAGPVSVIGAASPAAIAQVLAREPAAFAGTLLAAGNWPWAHGYLAGLSGEYRVSVEARRAACEAAPARQGYILDSVAAALSARAEPALSVRARHPLRRAGDWVKKWIR